MSTDPFEPETIRGRLSTLGREPTHGWHGRDDLEFVDLHDAAVLIPLTCRDGEFTTLFTHRSEELEQHSGEVSFPGGRVEGEDNTLVETALREAYEEVGLQPSDVEVFGALTEMPTVTGYQVTAFVGEFPDPYELIPSPDEIASIFTAPLRELTDPAIHRVETREFNDREFPVHFYEYDDYTIWGATGWLLQTLLDFLNLVDVDDTTPT